MARYILLDRSPALYAAVLPALHLTGPVVVASDDGAKWSARYISGSNVADPLAMYGFIDLDEGRAKVAKEAKTYASLSDLPIRAKALVEWAKRKVSAEKPTVIEGARELTEAQIRYEPCSAIGQIRYDGWGPVGKKSAHSFKAFHGSMCEAVALCDRAWGWRADGLVVSFHTGGRAMGLAYAPGDGDRRISLKTELFEKYDLESIYRTVLHELAHHAREELHKRTRYKGFNAHDAKFCEMLGMVDPTVRGDQRSCQFFVDDEDPTIVEAVAQDRGIVFSSEAGEMLIGIDSTRYERFRWNPIGTHRWPSKWEKLTDKSLVAFAKRFPLAERPLIVVRIEADKRFLGHESEKLTTLAQYIDDVVKHSPQMSRLREALT